MAQPQTTPVRPEGRRGQPRQAGHRPRRKAIGPGRPRDRRRISEPATGKTTRWISSLSRLCSAWVFRREPRPGPEPASSRIGSSPGAPSTASGDPSRVRDALDCGQQLPGPTPPVARAVTRIALPPAGVEVRRTWNTQATSAATEPQPGGVEQAEPESRGRPPRPSGAS